MIEDKRKYWKRIYKGVTLDKAKKDLSNKFLGELTIYEKNKKQLQEELQIFLKRLTEGQSPKSALSGLSKNFSDWYFFITKPETKQKEIKLELNIYEEGKAVGHCNYCYPRGNKNIHELKQCPYCKKWFCEKHLRPYRNKDDDMGHPCTK